MKLRLILLLTAILSLTACEREDDLDEIFIGKTWYMNGGTLNGKRLNADVKKFYAHGQEAYSISFTTGVFRGLLIPNAPFNGTWTVDGKKHTISLRFNGKPNISQDFDQQLYNILKDVKTYESGSSFLILKEDNDNFIIFGNSRSPQVN